MPPGFQNRQDREIRRCRHQSCRRQPARAGIGRCPKPAACPHARRAAIRKESSAVPGSPRDPWRGPPVHDVTISRPPRSDSATASEVRSTTAAKTEPASSRKRMMRGARPPIARPSSPSTISPRACSVCNRSVTAARPRSASRSRSDRVVATPDTDKTHQHGQGSPRPFRPYGGGQRACQLPLAARATPITPQPSPLNST